MDMQKFEALRKDLQQEVANAFSHQEKLQEELNKVQAAGKEAFESLTALETTMVKLGMLDKSSTTTVAGITTTKKRGRKPGRKPAVQAEVKVRKTRAKKAAAAPKAAAKKATKTTKKAAKTNAVEGRRAVARGDRPPMKEAMITVMGGPGAEPMGAAEIIEGLNKKGCRGTSIMVPAR